MLLSPIIYYMIEFLLFTVLSYDTLGYLRTINKNKDASKEDYSRLVFTWIFQFSLCYLSCMLCCLPLIAELSLVAKIFITIPLLQGTNRVKKIIFEDQIIQGMMCKVKNMITGTKPSESS